MLYPLVRIAIRVGDGQVRLSGQVYSRVQGPVRDELVEPGFSPLGIILGCPWSQGYGSGGGISFVGYEKG
jgi:hypothetical protein